jgi:hypothetical protein
VQLTPLKGGQQADLVTLPTHPSERKIDPPLDIPMAFRSTDTQVLIHFPETVCLP